MNEAPGEKSLSLEASPVRPINWLWISAFVSVVLLGVFVDSSYAPKSRRFLAKPLVIIGVAGSLLCLVFQKEKPKPGHPHQAGIILAVPADNMPFIMRCVGLFIVVTAFKASATGLAISGTIGFSLLLLLRVASGMPKGTRSWLGSSCRICDAGFGAYDFGATYGGDQRPITHCYRCGANRDASADEPLSPTAQAFLGGKVSEEGVGRELPMIGEPFPDDPLQFPWREQIIILVKLFVIVAIGLPLLLFFSVAALDGPYMPLRWLLIFVGIALFAVNFVIMNRRLRMPCPHCQTNLMDFAWGRDAPLLRGYALRKVNGRYVHLLVPRYCPFCGKNIDEPVQEEQLSGG